MIQDILTVEIERKVFVNEENYISLTVTSGTDMKNEPSVPGVTSQSLNRNCLKGVDVFVFRQFFLVFPLSQISYFTFFPLCFFIGREVNYVRVVCVYFQFRMTLLWCSLIPNW